MCKRGVFVFVFVFGFGFGFSFGQTAQEISDRAVAAMEVESMEMAATLTIVDGKGNERKRQLITQTQEFDGVSKTLLKFTAPADVKGTALLIFDYENQSDDMWIFLPALRKTRRIVSSEKGKSFMGSEFSNADMSIPNAADFSYNLLGEEVFEGHTCWKVESKCLNEDIEDENGYSRKLSWIEKGTYRCYKVEFYDLDNKLAKVQLISNYKEDPSGHAFAYSMEMKNLQNNRKSLMKVDRYQSGMDFSEDSFSPALLQR